MGRAGRQWWNPEKQRYEGMTIIDSVVYVGSSDPDIDKRNRTAALKKAIRASDILNDNIVFSPYARPEVWGGNGRPSIPPIFSNDLNVEEYSTLEELHSINSEISKINREDWVEIDAELKAKLQAQATRVGTVKGIFKKIKEIPEGMGEQTIYNIVYGEQKTAPREHIDAILSTFEEMPSLRPMMIRDLVKIRAERKRTKTGARNLFRMISDPPFGLTETNVKAILSGQKEEVYDGVLEAIFTAYASIRQMTDAEKRAVSVCKSKKLISVRSLPTELAEGKDEISRVEIARIIRGDYNDVVFQDCNIKVVIESLPYREVTNAERTAIIAERERTGATPAQVFAQIDPCPKGLNEKTIVKAIEDIVRGLTFGYYVKDILSGYKKLQDNRRIQITEEMRNILNSHIDRTDKRGKAITAMAGCPETLKYQAIEYWRRNAKSAFESEWNWVMNAYESLPDKTPEVSAKNDGPLPM